VARFDWPGTGWCNACAEHASRALGVAQAMGFKLTLDQLAPLERGAASHEQTGAAARRCFACDATLRICLITRSLSDGKRCCSDCRHPDPLAPVDA